MLKQKNKTTHKSLFFILFTILCPFSYGQIWDSFDFNHAKGGTPLNLTVCNEKLFFTYNDGVHGYELWVSDGTLEGTNMVKDIFVGPHFSKPSNLRVIKDKIFFGAHSTPKSNLTDEYSELWVSDGTEIGTKPMKSIDPLYSDRSFKSYIIVNDIIYFDNEDSLNGSEIWIANIDFSNPRLLKDIKHGVNSSNPEQFFYFNNKVFFTANNGSNGRELWVTDGTDSGTYLFKDINQGVLSSSPSGFLICNNKMYFSANDGIVGNELWVTDGTDTGTDLFMDINPGSLGSDPRSLRIVDDKFVFSAQHEMYGFKLWFSNGSPSGTYHIDKLTPNLDLPSPLVIFDNKVVLNASGQNSGSEIWICDGTEQGTILIKDIYSANSPSPLGLTVYRNKVYFSAVSHLQNRGFWVTDGTEVGTRSIAPTDFNSNNPLENTHYFVEFDSSLFFVARFYPFGERIWRFTYDPNSSLHVSEPYIESVPFQIFPNPNSGNFKLVGALNKPFSGLVSVKDIHGREVLIKEIEDKMDFNEELDLTNYQSGVYFITLISAEGNFPYPIIKVVKQ